MWACTDQLRKELKDDLKPIAASLAALNTNVALLSTNMALMQQTLTAQQATLKGQSSKLDVVMLLVLGLLGTEAVLHMPK